MSNTTKEHITCFIAIIIIFVAYGIAGHFDYEDELQRQHRAGIHLEER